MLCESLVVVVAHRSTRLNRRAAYGSTCVRWSRVRLIVRLRLAGEVVVPWRSECSLAIEGERGAERRGARRSGAGARANAFHARPRRALPSRQPQTLQLKANCRKILILRSLIILTVKESPSALFR